MEQQLKKAEAAQRRKAQIEKAARESEVGGFSSFSIVLCGLTWLITRG